MSEVIWIAAGLFMVVGVPVALWRMESGWALTAQARRATIWRALAARRAGRLQDGVVEAVIEHVLVRLDGYRVRSGRSSLSFTRAYARFAAGAGPRFRVFREGLLSPLGKKLGAQDVVLGDDPAFDARFMVKCEDEVPTRLAWSHRARRLMYGLERAEVESDGEVVTVTVAGYCEDDSTLEAMLDLAGELASYGLRELGIAELCGARWIEPTPPWDTGRLAYVEIETLRGPVALRCIAGPERAALQMTFEHARGLPIFSVDIVAGRLGNGAPRRLVPDSALALVATVRDATLSGAGRRARLAFEAIPSREVIEAGVQLLVAFAGGQQSAGAFR